MGKRGPNAFKRNDAVRAIESARDAGIAPVMVEVVVAKDGSVIYRVNDKSRWRIFITPAGWRAMTPLAPLEVHLERTAAARVAVGVSDNEEIERRNREKLREANECARWSAADALDRLQQIEESAAAPKKPKKDDAA
jgi:hypothetical protein